MRRTTLLTRSLQAAGAPPPDWSTPQLPAGLRVTRLDADVARLIPAELDAYAIDHVDRADVLETVSDGSFARLLAGEALGPVLADASGVVVDEDGVAAGAIVVVDWPGGDLWPGGPWVADVFVRVQHQGQGIGVGLLKRAIAVCSAAGADRMGLAVTEGNPARELYEGLGFAAVDASADD